ncbi:MAG TPA: hypothetical protein VLI54_06550 [Bacillota bacterium]|nr:hypothetical protein [Bacillota bacterium]
MGAIAPATAHAAATCVQGPMYWPSSGQVVTSNSSTRSISLTFTPTQAQLNALACHGGYLKVDFVTQNAGLSGANYTLSTNVPGAVKEVPVYNTSFYPGATGIYAASLQADQTYYVTATWTGGNAAATFSANWVAAHAASSNLIEKDLCKKGTAQGTFAWCYFATVVYPGGSYTHSLTGGYVPLGGTYTIQ